MNFDFLSDYWLFVRGTTGPRAGQWCEALIISLICTWTNGLANNQDAGNLRRHRHHRGITVIEQYACIGRDRPLWVLNVRCLSFMITTKVSAERYCKAIYDFMDYSCVLIRFILISIYVKETLYIFLTVPTCFISLCFIWIYAFVNNSEIMILIIIIIFTFIGVGWRIYATGKMH